MRLSRFQFQSQTAPAFFAEDQIVPLKTAAAAFRRATGEGVELAIGDDLLAYLPPTGEHWEAVRKIWKWWQEDVTRIPPHEQLRRDEAQLLVPVPRPNKLFLLAGNYADHVREGGGVAAERAATFPYVFMKPPSTTLVAADEPMRIPAISPAAIDWELELAVVIGKRVKGIAEAEALSAVAGYTIVNDISNRRFRPNPGRQKRDRDGFFDWLHGKWFDSFCPCGPCITAAPYIPDPQNLDMRLTLNGDEQQAASTALQIFPVAAVIEFIASFVTLEPGDIISTGTPAGVGNAKGLYLKPGDRLEASIAGIGTLVTPVLAESPV